MINYFISKELLISIWNNTFNSFLLNNLYKVGVITIIYYIIYILDYYNKFIQIDVYYLYWITILTLSMTLYRLYCSYIHYKKNLKNIYKVYNNIITIYNQFIVINSQHIEHIDNDIYEEELSDDEIDDTKERKKENIIDLNLQFKEILLVYCTYFFVVCKTSHSNYTELAAIPEDYKKFDIYINEAIIKLYFNCNINNYQFKLNNLDSIIYKFLYSLHKKHFYSITDINDNLKKLNKNITTILFSLNNNKIHHVLYNYICDLLILLNLIYICIYYVIIEPNLGIIYVIIISYIYIYIHFLYLLYTNCFYSTQYGIDLTNILHNLYDELYLIYIFNVQKINYFNT